MSRINFLFFSRKKPRLDAETLVASISEDGDFTDFTLESVDGAKFPCHRAVLAAQSRVLKNMFLKPMKERKTSILQLKYKADIVGKFVKFFYEREIKEDEEEGSLRNYLELAEKYDLPHLKKQAEELLLQNQRNAQI